MHSFLMLAFLVLPALGIFFGRRNARSSTFWAGVMVVSCLAASAVLALILESGLSSFLGVQFGDRFVYGLGLILTLALLFFASRGIE